MRRGIEFHQLDDLNLIIGSNYDYQVSLILNDLRKLRDVNIVEVSHHKDILEPIDFLSSYVKKYFNDCSKLEKKFKHNISDTIKSTKVIWLVVDDYISCYELNKDIFDLFQKKVVEIIRYGFKLNIRVLIGGGCDFNKVNNHIKRNMNIIRV